MRTSAPASPIELEEGKFYTIQTNSRLEKIPYKEILFLSRDGKNTSITTAGGAAKVRKSLQQVYEELAAEEFIFIVTDRPREPPGDVVLGDVPEDGQFKGVDGVLHMGGNEDDLHIGQKGADHKYITLVSSCQ